MVATSGETDGTGTNRLRNSYVMNEENRKLIERVRRLAQARQSGLDGGDEEREDEESNDGAAKNIDEKGNRMQTAGQIAWCQKSWLRVSSSPPDRQFMCSSPQGRLFVSSSPPNRLFMSSSPPDRLSMSSSPPDRLSMSSSPPDRLFMSGSPPDRLFMSSEPPDLPLSRLDPSAFVYGCESKWLVHFPCVVHCRDHVLQLPSAVNPPATVDRLRRGSKRTQPHTSCTPQPSGTRSAVHNPLRLCCASVNGVCRPVHCDATTISIASRLALAIQYQLSPELKSWRSQLHQCQGYIAWLQRHCE